jgi:signal peptidase
MLDQEPQTDREGNVATAISDQRTSLDRRAAFKKFWSVFSVLLTVAVAVGWFAYLRPASLGGDVTYVRVAGISMEPLFHSDDLVLVTKKPDYSVGEVVAFRVPEGYSGAGALVIHRIIGGSAEEGYILQGDNRDTRDLWQPKPTDVAGTYMFKVPGARHVLPRFLTPLGIAAFAGILTLLVMLGGDDKPKNGPGRPSSTPE